MICASCIAFGRNAHSTSAAITVDHVTPELIDDLRAYLIAARQLSQTALRPITRDSFVTFIADVYRDLDTAIIDRRGQEVFLDLECLEGPSVGYWARDYLLTPQAPSPLRLKMLTRPRIAVIASILKAADPHAGACWGVRAANDHNSLHRLPVIGEAVRRWIDRPAWGDHSEGVGTSEDWGEEEFPF